MLSTSCAPDAPIIQFACPQNPAEEKIVYKRLFNLREAYNLSGGKLVVNVMNLTH